MQDFENARQEAATHLQERARNRHPAGTQPPCRAEVLV